MNDDVQNGVNCDSSMTSQGDGIPIVHSHAEMGALAEEVLDRLKLGQEDPAMVEDNDQYLAEEQIVCDKQPSATSVVDPELLNEKQRSIYDRFKKYFLQKKNAIDGRGAEPAPLENLIHGGPGKIRLNVIVENYISPLFSLYYTYSL